MIGVISAGEAATRLQLIPHSKEMTGVEDKPMIEDVIDNQENQDHAHGGDYYGTGINNDQGRCRVCIEHIWAKNV